MGFPTVPDREKFICPLVCLCPLLRKIVSPALTLDRLICDHVFHGAANVPFDVPVNDGSMYWSAAKAGTANRIIIAKSNLILSC
jgi:hypothetical protein